MYVYSYIYVIPRGGSNCIYISPFLRIMQQRVADEYDTVAPLRAKAAFSSAITRFRKPPSTAAVTINPYASSTLL